MNQEASEPLPCPVPSPSAVGMLGRSESPGGRQRFPWARSAYKRSQRSTVELRDYFLNGVMQS